MVAGEAEGRAEALRRIAACRAAQAEELDLGGLQLTALDGELLAALCELGWLRRLFLGPCAEAREKPQLVFIDGEKNTKLCNALGALPGALFDALTRLEQLDLSLNALGGLPASIANLTGLTSLDLGYNGIEVGAAGAQALAGLRNLTSLDLGSNGIGDAGAQALAGLRNLTSLDLRSNGIGAAGAQALAGLRNLTSLNLEWNGIGDAGAQALAGLRNLTSLNLGDNGIGAAGAQALAGLRNLTSLDLRYNGIGAAGAQALAGLRNLTSLDLRYNGIGAAGAQALAGLRNLTSLNLEWNGIGDAGAQALAGLRNLTSLDLRSNGIGDAGAQALAGLRNLTSLNLEWNGIGAAGAQALAGLRNLTSLNLTLNGIGAAGAQALAGLRNLTSLDLRSNGIGDAGAQALAGLRNLTSLDLRYNGIGAAGAQALAGLRNLTSLDLRSNGIGDAGAQALAGLRNLTSLNLRSNGIGGAGAQALAGLRNLTSLDLSGNEIGDLAPLVSLRNLRTIDLSRNRLDHDVPEFWMLPSLQEAILLDASLPGVPAEILSKHGRDNCLHRLRAHLADLTGDDAAVVDVKFMILGNGRVGKTQICRRLRGESFDAAVPSTHGIQVSSVPLAPQADPPVTLKIWDFGGQDIYHGTHALFLKSRAVFPLVWTPTSETEQFHTHGGFTFRNQPLAYWLAYVRTFGGARSPVLVIQSQCDRPEDERDPLLLPPGALDGLGYKKVLHYSAKVLQYTGDGMRPRGHAALVESLLDAVQWLRRNQGVAKIGPGRAAVKAALEAKLAAGERRIRYRSVSEPHPEEAAPAAVSKDGGGAQNRGHPSRRIASRCPQDEDRDCLLASQSYLDLCAEVERGGKGRISDPGLLLEYLHDSGTVFYREGLFGDQIILDQAWALDAVYAVFDRASQTFRKIERNRGRFWRSDLAESVWQQHGVPEQELFLSFMRQCGICFTIQKEDRERRIEAEYIAPDLLPLGSDAETQNRLKLVWDDAGPDAEAVLSFALLPGSLMRALIARIGGEAGLAAEYWRDGVCFYDEKTASRALIAQRWTQGWAGEVHIATKRGQAGVLLQRLIELVEDDRVSLGARPDGKTVTGIGGIKAEAADTKAGEVPFRPAHEPSRVQEYYVSYAWGDDKTPEGKARDAVVERLCSEAEARSKRIIRDKDAMKLGDRISTFMDRIGRGDRVFIMLSDKYLQSPYCMYELHEIWRNCREDDEEFLSRIRVYTLGDAKIWTPRDRAICARYWRKQHTELKPLADDLGDRDHRRYRLMVKFAHQVGDILATMADIVQPRSFDELVKYGLDDARTTRPATPS